MKYADQAKWYLNGFWTSGAEGEAESIWKFANKFIELDAKKKEGNELDEFFSHKFLESLGETLTVIQLRETLRKIDVDANGKMALLEYLAFKYSKSIKEVLESPQGDNTEKINEAQAKLQAVQDAMADLQTQLEQQQQALTEQKQALKESDAALAESKQALAEQERALATQRAAEEVVRKAEAELRAAIDDLRSQEESYHNQIKTLESKSQDPALGTVAKSKAANELAQLKQQDPLPLRKAKVTQEAALKKVEKERRAQEEATAAAESKARDAEAKKVAAEEKKAALEEKTRALEEQTRRVEEAVRETEVAMKEAVDYLEEVKRQGGVAYGALWWMDRELKEAQKYMPKRKQQS